MSQTNNLKNVYQEIKTDKLQAKDGMAINEISSYISADNSGELRNAYQEIKADKLQARDAMAMEEIGSYISADKSTAQLRNAYQESTAEKMPPRNEMAVSEITSHLSTASSQELRNVYQEAIAEKMPARNEMVTTEMNSYEDSRNELYTQEMDNETILIAYKLIKEAAEKIGRLSNKVYSAAEYCSEKDFAIKGITYEESIGDCSNCFEFIARNIDEYADLLMDTLQSQIRQEEWIQEERRLEPASVQEYNVVIRD